jgi:hypothetical protein
MTRERRSCDVTSFVRNLFFGVFTRNGTRISLVQYRLGTLRFWNSAPALVFFVTTSMM